MRIDTHLPTATAPSAARVVRHHTATLKYKVADVPPNGGTADVTIKIKTLAGRSLKTLASTARPVNTLLSEKFRCDLRRGTYRFFVYAKDTAGNAQTLPVGSNRLIVR